MNKTVLVTGASRGIGKGIALAFAKRGYNVVINYASNNKAAQETLAEVERLGARGMIVKANVASPNEVANMFAEIAKVFGNVDVLVNNAGVTKAGLLIDNTDEDIEKLIDINLKGAILCCREALKTMMSNMSGKIINISSMWGERGGSFEVVYSASKAGVLGLTKALAKETGNMHININAICPGAIETDMSKALSEDTRKMLIDATPFARLGQPEDIAELAVFLASDEASFITGQSITVDGGIRI